MPRNLWTEVPRDATYGLLSKVDEFATVMVVLSLSEVQQQVENKGRNSALLQAITAMLAN